MISKEMPENFNPKFVVVSCFVDCNNEIILLHRQDHKSEGNTWGVPAGKVDDGENISEAMIREIREETGLVLPSSQISYFDKLFVRYSDYDFIYHMFYTKLSSKPEVIIQPKEHKDFKWVSPENALSLPLVKDLDACIKLFYKL